MAITDRRLKLLNLPEENVSDLRAALFRRNARDCQYEYLEYKFLIPKRFSGDDGAAGRDISNCF